MADIFQDGPVATLHRLGGDNTERLERELLEFSKTGPIALVLPCHADELDTPALNRIIAELAHAEYLEEIVVGIDGADAAAWARAKQLFEVLPQKTRLLWNDGPRVTEVLRWLSRAEVQAAPAGKGRNLWLCFGYVIARGSARMVAAHDCDIHTFSREMLARLCYPVAHPGFGFDFCKGFSARFSDRIHGRVMRLLFTPLVRSLQSLLGPLEFLTFLDSFRYPIGGEVSIDTGILRQVRIPGDWGVETGMMAEIFRICPPAAVCQIDLAGRYDHKHRELSPADPGRGLNKMARDIALRIFRSLAGQGVKLDPPFFESTLELFARTVEATMRFSAADAGVNGLSYNRSEEELAASTFAGSIRTAAHDYLIDPFGDSELTDWGTIEAVAPEILPDLLDAVCADARN